MKSSNKPTDREDLILAGRVTGAHGIRGALKVHAYAESMTLYKAGENILLSLPGGPVRTMTVQWIKPHGRGLLMGLESVNERDQAEGLVGSALLMEKSRLPVLEKDSYYWFELVGLSVYDTDGSLLGRLDKVIPTAGNDVYVVKGKMGGRSRELLIPAVGDVVLNVDVKSGTMTVDPPEGL